jgi:hypothetical protein
MSLAPSASLASLLGRIYYSTVAPTPIDPGDSGPWRPPQWGSTASFSVTATDPVTNQQTVYVFDAVMRAAHDQRVIKTLNPIQTGAAISDHAFVLPARLEVEIHQSDAMQSFNLSQWVSGPSKSVSAYQTLISLMKQRLPLQIATPLRTYDNMLIINVSSEETKDTTYSLNARVAFEELLTASVTAVGSASQQASSIPQVTNQTTTGQVQPQTVPSAILSQNNVLSAPASLAAKLETVPAVAASGPWSSTNIGSLTSALGI